jgi:GDPmannose 4,6-dehydratase
MSIDPETRIDSILKGKKVSMKKALITGIAGQDGSYLAELLLEKGYEVHGMIRRSSSFNTGRINHIYEHTNGNAKRFFLHYGDLNDASSINTLIRNIRPDEIYNLGAQSHVRISFDVPEYTGEIDALGVVRILESIRETGIDTRFYQASTSELYGKVRETPQTELTPFYPRSPYACAKAYAFHIVVNYRESYGMHASNGILFNHESPRRGRSFVTRKITLAAARIKLGLQDCLYLGNIEARRDWGFAGDYVEAMWLMLQQPQPDDYIIATGETRSVREFAERVFARLGMPIAWEGSGADERGLDRNTGKVLLRIDPQFYRPAEVDFLLGDCTKAKKTLGWKLKTGFDDLVAIMTDADLEKAERERRANGYVPPNMVADENMPAQRCANA